MLRHPEQGLASHPMPTTRKTTTRTTITVPLTDPADTHYFFPAQEGVDAVSIKADSFEEAQEEYERRFGK